ncbi:MAG: NADPH-dependent 2,4-dienoyl-CoA reductase, partial [Alphaproteobacteria bacterium]|nr:NADPH-dependent 2,4-dienoyl-CoA reductase [Alphaproteobacteria bacterium]
TRGAIEGINPEIGKPAREIFLLQRKNSKIGSGLGKTSGWAHRAGLLKKGVKMIAGCDYLKIDDQGLHVRIGGEEKLLPVDNVIICAGQEPMRELVTGLKKPFHLIGGAEEAVELDAKRAIDQGTRLMAEL